MERLILALRLGWHAPLLIGLRSPARALMLADAAHCTENHALPPGWPRGGAAEMLHALIRPESRTLYYARLRSAGGVWRLVQVILARLYKGQVALELSVGELGGGLYLMHGFATIIVAERIGAHCRISQQVTIGHGAIGAPPPTLGDDVHVSPGATIIGPVHIGDHAIIGAGAVVVHDVPAGCTVGGVPARILSRAR